MAYDLYLHLDFDGVLHEDPQQEMIPINELFVHVPLFEQCLRQADPDSRVGIVISSMWRLEESLADLRSHFSEDIAGRIVGVTPNLPFPNTPWAGPLIRGHRQSEIEVWMAYNAAGVDWIALDDRQDGFKMPCERLVRVTPYDEDGRGLDEYTLRELFWAIKDRLDPRLGAPKKITHLP